MLLALSMSKLTPLHNKLVRGLMLSLMLGFNLLAHAHTFFVGLTDISVNPNTLQTEIIHQYTAHDIQNTIAEQQQIHFSTAHPEYDQYIQNYIEKHFMVSHAGKNLNVKWIGLELVRDKVLIYQEIKTLKKLKGLVVKNDILVNTYLKQVNTVNYQDSELTGTLTFTESVKRLQIMDDN